MSVRDFFMSLQYDTEKNPSYGTLEAEFYPKRLNNARKNSEFHATSE